MEERKDVCRQRLELEQLVAEPCRSDVERADDCRKQRRCTQVVEKMWE